MVKVYMEKNGMATPIAVFADEHLYSLCFMQLSREAARAGSILTESVKDEIDLDDLIY